MSISTLVSLAWNGNPPDPKDNDIDVLVLTGRTYFVHFRVKKSTTRNIDWACAGTRASEPGDEQGETIVRWHHILDSRQDQPFTDSGVNRPYPKDPTLTLERGRMLNPATGAVEPYVEVWKDVDAPSGTLVAFLEKEDGKAFIGMIGKIRLGIGKRWAWTVSENGEARSFGEVEDVQGQDVSIINEGTTNEGDRVGTCWLVREIYHT